MALGARPLEEAFRSRIHVRYQPLRIDGVEPLAHVGHDGLVELEQAPGLGVALAQGPLGSLLSARGHELADFGAEDFRD